MNYSIIKPIGNQGGFGQVYQCLDENAKVFALKRLKEKDEFSVSRFEREVRLMSRLNHPNVISLIAYNLTCEDPFYVMPLYLCSLRDLIPSLVGDYQRQFSIINSVLAGVEYLHSEGVLHRDLKPDNILYNSEFDVAITDFGLGIQLDSGSTTLTKYTVFGTDRYCSPEQKANSHTVDQRTDIYALGMIIEDIVSNFNSYNDYDKGIKYIVEKCTERDRENRFGTVSELRRSINLVYKYILGVVESRNIEEAIVCLESGEIDNQGVIELALNVQKEQDLELVEKFFNAISTEDYIWFENNNKNLAENLVNVLCNYWNQFGWPFSYIDSIANIVKKIFYASQNPKIKAKLLYQLIEMAINYNRWYAMGKAQDLLSDIKSDNAVQIELESLLRTSWLDIGKIESDENNLPTLIKDLYNEKKDEANNLWLF